MTVGTLARCHLELDDGAFSLYRAGRKNEGEIRSPVEFDFSLHRPIFPELMLSFLLSCISCRLHT